MAQWSSRKILALGVQRLTARDPGFNSRLGPLFLIILHAAVTDSLGALFFLGIFFFKKKLELTGVAYLISFLLQQLGKVLCSR